jgi:polyphosphate kinase
MPRNLDRRVEVLAPVEQPALRARLDSILELLLADDTGAWQLDDTSWRRVPTVLGCNAQADLQRNLQERARND